MINKEGKVLVITIADVMTREVVSVRPEDSIEKVISVFAEKNFAGLPVVDEKGILAGIITQYDLVTKGSGIHIPTLVKTLEGVNMVQPERMVLEGTLAPIKKLLAKDVMNTDPLCVRGSDPIEQAVLQFAEHHKVNPIIVVDDSKKLIGVISRHDLIKILAMKELGRVVDTAIERGGAAKGAEEAVAGVVSGVRKEFFFMPKYGVGKWVALGLSIFVIGLLASFLFIVKLPSGIPEVEKVVEVPIGEGATLIASSPKTEAKIGEEIPVTLALRIKTPGVNIKRMIVGLKFDPKLVDFEREGEDFMAGENFDPSLRILNLRESEFISGWEGISAASFEPGQTVPLSTVIFVAKATGEIKMAPTFGGDRSASVSAVVTSDAENIVDAAEGFTMIIK
jgi:CBS domain-containing protein